MVCSESSDEEELEEEDENQEVYEEIVEAGVYKVPDNFIFWDIERGGKSWAW